MEKEVLCIKYKVLRRFIGHDGNYFSSRDKLSFGRPFWLLATGCLLPAVGVRLSASGCQLEAWGLQLCSEKPKVDFGPLAIGRWLSVIDLIRLFYAYIFSKLKC